MLDDLYKVYGQLMIQSEILQGRINEVKAKIAQELDKKPLSEKPE